MDDKSTRQKPPTPAAPPRPGAKSSPTIAAKADEPGQPAPGDGAPISLEASPSALPPTARVDPYVGKTIDGRYLVEKVLGEGGMGVVYAAKHKVIGKRVAIKVLRGDMAKDAEITERFLQEARAASSIGNPHIIDISDFGTLPDGSTYFVMEFLNGRSLTDAMEESKALKVPRLLHIAKQIAAGLGAAHEAGIVHRDLKPDNVMLIQRSGTGTAAADKDFVKILDFGIAKVSAETSRLTKAGSVFGTPHYMSPEQAAGTAVDLRTDIYALGIILYEMASGRVPFDADNFMGILTQHMYKAPPPILTLVPTPDIPPALDAVIQKCLTKKVEGRYGSMAELLLDLEKVERGEAPGALAEMMARSGGFNIPADYFRVSGMPPPVPATPAGLPKRGRLPLLVAIGVVGTAGIAALAVSLAGSSSSKASAQIQPVTSEAPPVQTSAAAVPTASAPVVPAAPAVQHVALVVEPFEAKVVKQGTSENINTSPGQAISIDVVTGAPVVVELSAPGKKTKQVTVDGKISPLIVRMENAPAPALPPTKPTKPSKPADAPGGASSKKCDPLLDPSCDPFKK